MIHNISISFCVSKDTEVDIPEGKSVTDGLAKAEFMKSEHFKHLYKMLKVSGLFIDDFNVILNE